MHEGLHNRWTNIESSVTNSSQICLSVFSVCSKPTISQFHYPIRLFCEVLFCCPSHFDVQSSANKNLSDYLKLVLYLDRCAQRVVCIIHGRKYLPDVASHRYLRLGVSFLSEVESVYAP